MKEVEFRNPVIGDASAIYELVSKTEKLDLNSWYYYAIFVKEFRETCMIAEVDGVFSGFVTGFMRPEEPETLFLWQTASTLKHGVNNLGLDLLVELVRSLKESTIVKYVEATVDPSNRAIGMQFRLLARKLKAEKTEETLFSSANFDELEHDELLIRIGPIS